LKEDDQRRHLPVIHCRECGAMGWGGTKREQDQQINADGLVKSRKIAKVPYNINPTA